MSLWLSEAEYKEQHNVASLFNQIKIRSLKWILCATQNNNKKDIYLYIIISYACNRILMWPNCHPSIYHLFFLFLYFWFWLQFATAAAGTLLFLGWGLELITSSWNRWGILVYSYDSRVWIFWPVTFHILIPSFVSFRLNILNSRFGNVVNVSGIHDLRRSMETFHTSWRQ